MLVNLLWFLLLGIGIDFYGSQKVVYRSLDLWFGLILVKMNY